VVVINCGVYFSLFGFTLVTLTNVVGSFFTLRSNMSSLDEIVSFISVEFSTLTGFEVGIDAASILDFSIAF
jgi:hypothetical protein